MRAVALVLGLIFALSVVVSATSANVVELTDADYNAKTSKGSDMLPMFISYTAQWCGHCKRLHPTWDALADQLAEEGSAVTMANIDADVNSGAGRSAGIRGFPTLKFIDESGTVTEYSSGHDMGSLKSFVEAMGAPPMDVDVAADWAPAGSSATTETGFVLLGAASEAEVAAFEAVAGANRMGLSFAVVAGGEGAASVAVRVAGSRSEEEQVSLAAPLTEASIAEFVAANRLPWLCALAQDTYQELAQSSKPTFVVALPGADATKASAEYAALHALSRNREAGAQYAWIDSASWAQFLASFGITEFPAAFVWDISRQQHYTQDAEAAAAGPAGYEAWLGAVLAGKVAAQSQGASSGAVSEYARAALIWVQDNKLLFACCATALMSLFWFMTTPQFQPEDAPGDDGENPVSAKLFQESQKKKGGKAKTSKSKGSKKKD